GAALGDAHDALETERQELAVDAEPQAHAARLVQLLDRPGTRADLAVERQLDPAVAARVVGVRQELLPTAPAVLRERGPLPALPRRRAGRREAPRRLEQDVDPAGRVDQLVQVGALVRQHRRPQRAAVEHQRPPPAALLLADADRHRHQSPGRVSRMNQFAVSPQSTVRFVPVIADASSEARNANAAAISSGLTSRFIGTRANWPFRYSISFGPTAFSVISVCVKPGLTQFERMPCSASSSARVRLSPSRAAFDAL